MPRRRTGFLVLRLSTQAEQSSGRHCGCDSGCGIWSYGLSPWFLYPLWGGDYLLCVWDAPGWSIIRVQWFLLRRIILRSLSWKILKLPWLTWCLLFPASTIQQALSELRWDRSCVFPVSAAVCWNWDGMSSLLFWLIPHSLIISIRNSTTSAALALMSSCDFFLTAAACLRYPFIILYAWFGVWDTCLSETGLICWVSDSIGT